MSAEPLRRPVAAIGDAAFAIVDGGRSAREAKKKKHHRGGQHRKSAVDHSTSTNTSDIAKQPLRVQRSKLYFAAASATNARRLKSKSHLRGSAMLQIKVVLIDTTGTVKPDTMAAAAEALNVQVTRDLPQFWDIHASVSYRPDPNSIPQGMWPVQLVKTLPPQEGGFHRTKHNQPYAKVIVTPGSDEWTIDASHETLEMLVDPYGNRLQTANAIDVAKDGVADADGKYEYLVEACDPCEANKYAYQIDGTMVSDFITPNFYDPDVTSTARYSFTGAIKKPRDILPGGYISWIDPQTSEMKQILWVNPSAKPTIRDLGPAPKNMSLREFVEAKTFHLAYSKRPPPPKATVSARKRFRADLERAALVRAKHYV